MCVLREWVRLCLMLTRKERLLWAVEAEVDPGVVDRLLAGKNVRAASRRVLEDAARRLKLTIPAAPIAAPAETSRAA